MGAVMNKALTLRSGRQHGHRYIPALLDDLSEQKLDTSYLATHTMALADAPQGYDLFRHRRDGCQRVVFRPTDHR
jgi:threonine dehydrogenase-like Zn-dependent dehydrogenase